MLDVSTQRLAMPNRHAPISCSILTLMLAGFGFAQTRERDVSLHVAPEERAQIVVQLMAHVGPLMDHVAEQVAGRYQLRPMPALCASAQAALQEGDIKGFFRDASGAPSLEPLLIAALANHLNAQQIKDYLAFTRARKARNRQAVGAQMVAWADQHLTLTFEQREKLGQLFSPPASARMTAKNLLDKDADRFMDVVAKLRLDSTRLDPVLSESQVRVWDVMTREQAGQKPKTMTKESRVDPGVRRRDDEAKREEKIRMIVTARLAAHTEQLGELNVRAAKRLVLVAKGVVEQVLESQDRGRKEGRGNVPGADITSYPLYQATIKNVLSEEAYAKYQVSQAQRVAFRQHAMRDLVVAMLDSQVLLSERQREHCEKIAAKLPITKDVCAWVLLVELVTQVDREDLSPWQRRGLDAIFRAGVRWEK